MERKIYPIESEDEWLELRTHDITSTEISALFNINPYLSAYELFFRKKEGNIVKIDNEPMTWGRRLEEPVCLGLTEDFNIQDVRPFKDYISIPEKRIGSSFDYAIADNGLFEIKTVGIHSFKNWEIVDKEIVECPTFIEMQVQHELLVSGRDFALIGVLVGGQQGYLIRRNKDENVHKAILQQAEKFWRSIDENNPPSPDFSVDSKFITSLFNYAEPGKVIDATNDKRLNEMANSYKDIAEHVKMWEQKKEEIKAKILMTIGDAEKVKATDWSISAGIIGPKHIEYDRKGYRNFRVNWKKEKK